MWKCFLNPASLCLAVLKAAMCRVRVTAGTPRRWPRQSRSTMIPSTPCTSPELSSTSASPPADSPSFSLLISYFPVSLPLFSHISLSLLVVCLFLFTLTLLIFRICTKAALGRGKICCVSTSSRFLFPRTISNQRSQSSRLSNQQSSTATPEGSQCAEEKKRKNKPYTHTTS